MSKLIEEIKQGKLWDFHGGIHPAENKEQTSSKKIIPEEIPRELVLPIKQHIGLPGRILVQKGEQVLKGQQLTQADTHHSCPIHAPTSGKIVAIEPRNICHPSGLSALSIVLQPDGQDTWCEKKSIPNYQKLSGEALIEHIKQMGIAGLGGAGFPTARKIQSAIGRTQILIINGAECEPYITADDRLMQEHATEIVKGAQILAHILQPELILFAIEDNKFEAIAAIENATNAHSNMHLQVIPTKYPSGGEKQLIQILTGKEIPKDGIPADLGILMQNVATVFEIKRAVIDGEPLIKRVVTLVGKTLSRQVNRWVLLGTSLAFLLEKHGYVPDHNKPRLIIGGPMMGYSIPHSDIPVSKTTNCLLAPSTKEIPLAGEEIACIRCSACSDVCPVSLLPQQLFWYAKQQDSEKLTQYNLFDCIECGACSYVCSSEIPLVQYYRQAKANIRIEQEEQVAAELSKQRFEAKKARMEQEKIDREAKHQAAAKQRQQTMAANNSQDAVAAAIERVKAKQANSQTENTANTDATQSMQALREQRKQQAREKKADLAKASSMTPLAQTEQDPKKAAVSAAIARAKAKKAAQEKESLSESAKTPEEQAKQVNITLDEKKIAVAQAVARAKARKAQQEKENNEKNSSIELNDSSIKAENASIQNQIISDEKTDEAISSKDEAIDPKKAAVAAAIARAKAKKALQTQANNTKEEIIDSADKKEPLSSPNTDEAIDPKKAAVAAAIARAKAKKAAKENNKEEE